MLVAVVHVSIGRTKPRRDATRSILLAVRHAACLPAHPSVSQRPARGGRWWVRLLCPPEGVGTVRVTNPSLHHTCSLPASQNTNVRITNLCSAGFAESVVTPRDMYVYSAQRLPCRHVTLAVTRTCTLLFCLQPLRPAARPSRGQDPAVPISVACCRTRNARQVCVCTLRGSTYC